MSTETEDEKGVPPITGPYQAFAMEFRRLIGWTDEPGRPHLSTRKAARQMGSNHVTVANIAQGDKPAEQTIQKIARTFGADEDYLRSLVGYLPLNGRWSGDAQGGAISNEIHGVAAAEGAPSTVGEMTWRMRRALDEFISEGKTPRVLRYDVQTGQITVEEESEEAVQS